MVLAMATTTAPYPHPTPAAAPRMRLTREDVMTAREVADLLALPVSTVYYLARQGQLPASRLGRTWRFLRPRIEELLDA
jgi:excisionase family DNA binding protein